MIDRPTLKALVTALIYDRKPGEYMSTAVRNAEQTADIIMNTYNHDVSAIAGMQSQGQAVAWRDAVLDELALTFMDADQATSPREILRKVIAWNVQVALDPAVSEDAAALVERGRAAALAQQAKP